MKISNVAAIRRHPEVPRFHQRDEGSPAAQSRPLFKLGHHPLSENLRFLLRRGAMVMVGALLLAWPALYNRYPLLYPDSMTYLGDGRLVARALFLHQLADYYGMRSFFYSLGILPWHWNVTPWPIVAFQALLTAYVLWLALQSIMVQSNMIQSIPPRHTEARYLILVALLSLLTSVSWYSSLIMPDILGPLSYLCIYLLVFARDTLTRAGHVAVFLIAWWGITAHATHFMLAAGLCALLMLLLVLRLPFIQGRWKAVGEVAMVIALAAAAQFALHGYLYGEPSLNGERPPFLMARIIADGPGRWYLEQHCGQVKFAICDHVHDLAGDTDKFLWAPDGVWANADDDYAQRLRQEEIPFVLATVRAYPRQQLSISASAFWKQLTSFALYDLDPSDWVLEEFDGVLPGGRPNYLRSRQAQSAMPLEFFTSVHYGMIVLSLLTIGACTPRLLRRGSARMLGLAVVVLSVVVANALVTGALSNVEERYQSRVVWLLSLLAGLCVLDWLNERKTHRLAA